MHTNNNNYLFIVYNMEVTNALLNYTSILNLRKNIHERKVLNPKIVCLGIRLTLHHTLAFIYYSNTR